MGGGLDARPGTEGRRPAPTPRQDAPIAIDYSDPLFALAAAYRALFTVAGGYVTARLAPDRPMRHAWILAGIGLVAGLAGVVAYYAIGGAELGPAWYAISIPVEAIPCVWLGGQLAAWRRSSTSTLRISR